MTTVVAVDLDRTLIWSAHAWNGHQDDAVCVEERSNAPLSFIHASAVDQLTALVAGGRLVPVTTRTEAQYRRVLLPGGPARYAICLNGGRVLVEGAEDRRFTSMVERSLAETAPPAETASVLEFWAQSVSEVLGACRIKEAETLFHYAVFERPVASGAETAALDAKAQRYGWNVSVQGRKVYLIPRTLTKERALTYLEAAHGVRVVASAGDSSLDRGMLSEFPPGWTPSGSELHRSGQEPRCTLVTDSRGLRGGAEIVAALAKLVAADWS